MSKQSGKKTDIKPASHTAKHEGYHWDIRPEPTPTPRDRRWLAVSLTLLVVWLAVLLWLAYR